MNKKDEQLIEEAEEVGRQLYQAIIADMSDAERSRFTRWESLMLCGMLLSGVIRPGPAYTPRFARDGLRHGIKEGRAILG